MRKYCFLILLTALFACQEEETDIKDLDHRKDLHDTIISLNWSYGSVDFTLDLDDDSIDDVSLIVVSYYSSFAGAYSYLQVTPSNGFEIAVTNTITKTWSRNPTMSDTLFVIDTVPVAKAFHVGDTISFNDMFSDTLQMVSYSYYPTGPSVGYFSGLKYGINENDFFYLSFCKTENGASRLAWLKIKYSKSWAMFNSCNYFDGEKFMIKEKT